MCHKKAGLIINAPWEAAVSPFKMTAEIYLQKTQFSGAIVAFIAFFPRVRMKEVSFRWLAVDDRHQSTTKTLKNY